MTTPILTGIHYDMAERDYRLAPAIAGSDAKHILPPKTPAHYAAHMAGRVEARAEQVHDPRRCLARCGA
jgi:hypothetical protein